MEFLNYARKRYKHGTVVLFKSIERLIMAATTTMERAFVVTIWESACRIGELLGMSIRSVKFDRYGCVIYVKGKTGERRIRLVKAAPYLQLWVNHHPLRNQRDAPLWVTRYKEGWKEKIVKWLLYTPTIILAASLSLMQVIFYRSNSSCNQIRVDS